jgi:hypothetical protein
VANRCKLGFQLPPLFFLLLAQHAAAAPAPGSAAGPPPGPDPDPDPDPDELPTYLETPSLAAVGLYFDADLARRLGAVLSPAKTPCAAFLKLVELGRGDLEWFPGLVSADDSAARYHWAVLAVLDPPTAPL